MNDNVRLVQLIDQENNRRVALVKEPSLVLLKDIHSVYDLALKAIHSKIKVDDFINSNLSDESLDYSAIYNGESAWKILPSFDHPGNPFACIISGTGLTHRNSALNRQMMHEDGQDKLTDSIKMYQMGVENGFPEKGSIGIQPEWFYKGNGYSLKACGQPLEVPPYANDGGEEPEIAGVYVIDKECTTLANWFTTGNEFSDHIMEKKNYLYLAPSKLRQCAIGPELVIDNNFESFEGTVSILRKEETVWTTNINTGEKNMSHSLENIEYHHFKYASHTIPLQAHIHFFGADAFSYGNGIKLQDGDLMRIQWNKMGRALQNPIKISAEKEKMIPVKTIS